MTLADLESERDRLADEMEAITLRYEGVDRLPDGPVDGRLEGPAQRYRNVSRGIAKLNAKIRELKATTPSSPRSTSSGSGPSQAQRLATVAKIDADDGGTSQAGRRAVVAKLHADDTPTPAARFNVNRGPTGSDIFERSHLRVEDERHAGEFRDRALRAIDTWHRSTPEEKESAARLVDDPTDPQSARVADLHILSAGDPRYVKAFRSYVKSPEARSTMESQPLDYMENQIFGQVNYRAINEQAIASGQALVPPMLDPSVVFSSVGGVHPFREICTVKSIDTATYLSLTAGQLTAEYAGESQETADAAPTFGGITITPVRADAYMPVSNEFLADAADASEQILRLILDSRQVLESTSWVSSTGAGQTPVGLTTTLDLTTASRTSTAVAGSFGMADAYTAFGRLGARYRAGASWVANDLVWNQFRQSPKAINQLDNTPWLDSDDMVVPPKLIGHFAYPCSGMLGTQTTGNDVCVVGDFRQGAIVVSRIGTGIVIYDPRTLIGPNHRPIASTAVYCAWRSMFQVVTPLAFQMIRCS